MPGASGLSIHTARKYAKVNIMQYFSIIILALLFMPSNLIRAVTHCPPGTSWDRGAIGCRQTTCPAPSGRNYGGTCQCYDSQWGTPKPANPIDCLDSTGLLIKCVAEGQTCSGDDPKPKPSTVETCTKNPKLFKGSGDECKFIGGAGAGLSIEAQEELANAVKPVNRQRQGEHRIIESTLGDKTVKLGILYQLGNGGILFTGDGIHYSTTPAGALRPGFFSRAGNAFTDVISSPLNWFRGLGFTPSDQVIGSAARQSFNELALIDSQYHAVRRRDHQSVADQINSINFSAAARRYVKDRQRGETRENIERSFLEGSFPEITRNFRGESETVDYVRLFEALEQTYGRVNLRNTLRGK